MESQLVRQGIKDYTYARAVLVCMVWTSRRDPCVCVRVCSGWPTIPQVFVDGEFIGGCDIVTQMHQNGELETLLAKKAA